MRVLPPLLGLLVAPWAAAAQQPAAPAPAAPQLPSVTVCGQQAPPPRAIPPDGSVPIVLFIAPCFEAQGGTSLIEPQTYLFYIQLKQSRPSEGVWMPYDGAAETTIREDFKRLLNTNFLDNLSIETKDYTFPNGVVGKIVLYNMEERQRVKIVEYVGSKEIQSTKIDEKLKELDSEIRTDSFIDQGRVRKVEGIVRDMMKEKGFQFAEVTHEIKELPGGPKLVNLTFRLSEGPTVKIRKIDFVGNVTVSDRRLKRQMKNTKPVWWLSFINGRGKYQETKFEEDADKVTAYYRDRGYIRASVGVPEVRVLGDSEDKETRWIELRIPVTEGRRYQVGTYEVAGNEVIKTDALKPLFKLKPGEYYTEKNVRKGLEKAREYYGSLGYFEFTGFPDLRPRDDLVVQAEIPDALRPPEGARPLPGEPPPIVDVTMRMVEGQQYFVNRIRFTGNTTTHDNVIRREMRVYEEGVFNTEALKFSIRRLNQLGYFKPLEGGKDVTVDKTPGASNQVDVTLKLEEQNRNQINFGAGVSEFEGFFGTVSFQTSNFLGRGESLTLTAQAGSRAQTYSLSFTEPFLFDRNITGGFSIYRSDVRYVSQFTQRTLGGTVTVGFPLSGFSRMFFNYSYQRVRITDINPSYCNPDILRSNPFLRDSLQLTGSTCSGAGNAGSTTVDPVTGLPVGTTLVSSSGDRVISKITPSVVYNTVDQPIFPTQGQRYTASIDLAGIGGNTNFYKPTLEGVWYWRQNARMSFGTRAQFAYLHTFTKDGTEALPIFEKMYLGGEYTVRGFDIRSIGPQDPATGLVLGGNKLLLFNFEENFTIAGPLRVILFYDAGQVKDVGQGFSWKEDVTTYRLRFPDGQSLYNPLTATDVAAGLDAVTTHVWAFKTSTGVEARFMMPVLNVPFRLIFAFNPLRGGVRDNTLQPQSSYQFRFAVGSTF